MSRTIILIALATLFFTPTLDAQKSSRKNQSIFRAGATAGVTAAQIDGDELVGFNKLGITSGIFLDLDFIDNFLVSMEFNYTLRGSRTASRDVQTEQNKYHLSYVDLPLTFSYTDQGFRMEAGMAYGRLINAKVEIDSEVDTALEEAWRKDDLSLHFGMAYYFTENFGAGFRWHKSLRDAANQPGLNFINRWLSFRLNYRL